MIIRNVSRHDLDTALAVANLPTDAAPNYRIGYGGNGFGGNIVFKRCDRTTRHHYPTSGQFDVYTEPGTFSVTLTVKDSRAPGSRMNTEGTRHIKAACWHAHGAFMRALPPAATVRSLDNEPWSPGDELRDYNIGSMMYPCMASEACEC